MGNKKKGESSKKSPEALKKRGDVISKTKKALNEAKADFENRKEAESNEALDRAVVPLEESGRSGKGSVETPYRALFTKEGIANGGCLGHLDGHSKFDPELAEAQIRSLKAKGIKAIFGLIDVKKIQPIAERLGVEQVVTHLNASSNRLTARNIKIFEQLAGMKDVYVYCRHGAHRAIIATTGAFLKRGATSFGDAFRRAGGELMNFRGFAHAIPLLSQTVEYAKKQDIPVEERYLKVARSANSLKKTVRGAK